jgi:hypothetical protein
MSVTARLGGFVLLVAAGFLAAFLLGRILGPVSPVHGRSGTGMPMNAVLLRSAAGGGEGGAR